MERIARRGRRAKLLDGLDLARLQGAEIGALASPVVSRADGAVLYVDHADTETLRRKYAADPAVDTTAIVEVDAVWSEDAIRAALEPDRRLDYVVASHVAEHTPDLVSWLQELTSVLAPGGSIRLALPDKRFCFDHLRRETQLSDLLAAYHARARRPQVREVIDSEIHHLHLDLPAAWRGELDTDAQLRPDQLQRAFAFADRAKAGAYVDVHCWAFTLASFAAIMRQLTGLGLISLACTAFHDTEIDDDEFIVALAPAEPTEAAASWERVRREAAAPPGDDPAGWPQARRRWLQRGEETLHAQDRAEIDRLQAEIDALRTSTSWRITRPLRAAARLLRGG